MDNEVGRLARELDEKWEDRGWNEPDEKIDEKITSIEIKPLPINEEQYRACAMTLAKKAISNNDLKACEEYFELKRRAVFGNKYSEIDGMEDIERKMWEFGTGEKAVDNGRKR